MRSNKCVFFLRKVFILTLILVNISLSRYEDSIVSDAQKIIDIKKLGAKGDGIKDDTNIINKALKYSGTIYFPPGEYFISSSLKPTSNSKIIGTGTITTNKNRFFNAFHISSIQNVIIDGIKIKAKMGHNGFDCGIKIENSNNIEIKNVTMDNIGKFGTNIEYGWGIFVTGQSSGVKIKNNSIKNIKGGGKNRGDFILLSHCSDITVDGNYMDNCQRQGVAIISNVNNFRITNNIIKHPGAAGIDLEPHIDVDKYTLYNGLIEGNRIENYGSKRPESIGEQFWAVDFHDGIEDITFKNNICISGPNSTSHVSMINGARKIRIENNIFRGSVNDAAIVTYAGGPATDWVINNNTFEGLTGACLKGWQCENSVFSNNRIYGNGNNTAITVTAPINFRITGNTIVNYKNGIFLNCTEPNISFQIDSNIIDFTNLGVHINIHEPIIVERSSVNNNILSGKFGNIGLLIENRNSLPNRITFSGNSIKGVKNNIKRL